MAGTFGYTESTNIVVVTGGTSGTPADFASFVVADRAGVDTSLLSGGSPANNLALTYAIRPVEDLAILVKCIVANKTAEADFIFITGKDWRGAAQTESIDVTAGNGSYTSTKYWSEITTLDCSDNAAGGGTVWADGDLSVTQDVWGVIWDYGNSCQYQIDAIFDVGNGSTSTYFQSTKEFIYFKDDLEFFVKANATLKIGNLYGSWGYDGSHFSVGPDALWAILSAPGATLRIYASSIHIRTAKQIWLNEGTIDIRNSILSHSRYPGGNWQHRWELWSASNLNLQDVFVCNCDGLAIYTTPDTLENVHIHYTEAGAQIHRTVTAIKLNVTSFTTSDVYAWADQASQTAVLKDPKFSVSSPSIDEGGHASTYTLKEQYTCNIHVADKDGINLQSVTVLCEISDSSNYDTQEFSVSTAANGTIAEQTIDYKKWVGVNETLTNYTPMRLTLSKAGYETLVLENITVDGPIDWHLELQQQKQSPAPWQEGVM